MTDQADLQALSDAAREVVVALNDTSDTDRIPPRLMPSLVTLRETLAASPSPDTDREGEDEAIPVELAAWFNGRAAAIRDVVAHRASPPEYPGMALVPVPDLDRLARYVDLPRSKLPSPDTDAGLDERAFGDSIMAEFRLTVMRGGADELYSPSQMTTMLREIVDRQVARLATPDKEQPE